MNRLLIASLAAAGVSVIIGSAFAADISASAPAYAKGPAVVPMNWTGCFVGGNVGGAWSHTSEKSAVSGLDIGSDSASSIIGGGQVGCDYQVNAWIFGLQGLSDWTDLKGNHVLDVFASARGAPFTLFDSNKWLTTATARIGYTVQPPLLVYAKGGVAWTRDELSNYGVTSFGATFLSESATDNRTGWTAGVGVEYMFAPSWSVFAEYDYAGFGTRTVNFVAGPNTVGTPNRWNVTQDIQSATAGVNWHLKPW